MSIRRSNRRVTIKDVARRAGVSTQTISRVINQRPDVSPETRERVQSLIDELGYHPSELARSLIQQRSYTVGVITAGLRYVGISLTLNGIAAAAEAAGYSLLLKELPRFDVTDVRPALQALIVRQVDGILYASPQVGENWRRVQQALPGSHPPIVFLKGEPQPGHPTVAIDNYAGARLAVQHLLNSGRRAIGHIAGPLDWWEARQRKAGWEDGLRQAGMENGPAHYEMGNWSSASGEIAFRQLLQHYPQMDAVFAANDQMALAVLNVAHSVGKRVPEDLAVIGFDDLAESAFFTPPLTTIRQELGRLGEFAVRHLLMKIEAGGAEGQSDVDNRINLVPELVIRQSA